MARLADADWSADVSKWRGQVFYSGRNGDWNPQRSPGAAEANWELWKEDTVMIDQNVVLVQ